jgi:hypothetical protein
VPYNHAGTIVIKPFLDTTEDGVGLAVCRHRRIDVPDDQGGAARHDRRRQRVHPVHPVDPGRGRHPDGGSSCHHQGRGPQVRPRHRRGIPQLGHPLQRPLPRLHRTPHGLREVADVQAPGVDVSEAAIATARGRIGTPVEVVQAALFPASDAASFGNGAHQFVEKGFTAGGNGRNYFTRRKNPDQSILALMLN